MWRIKGCPRCKGDVLVDHEEHRLYETCLQCGYRHEPPDEFKTRPQVRLMKTISQRSGAREPKREVIR